MHNRLGFAVQLATVRVVGRFLTDPLDVPWPVVQSLAGQLGIADSSVLKLYAQRGQAGYEHAAEISAAYGCVDFADPTRHEELKLFLSARAWTSSEGPVRLFERAAVWLRERKILLPDISTLTRLVAEVRAEANDRLYSALINAAGPKSQFEWRLPFRLGNLKRNSGRSTDVPSAARASLYGVVMTARIDKARSISDVLAGLDDAGVRALIDAAGPVGVGIGGQPRQPVSVKRLSL